ncbi:hypothetical protein F4801DRAFT_532168 [Xylaria longipes]|nr:hypothetical protein F4801DRAFT_532168 [Xylaria longipes]
MSFSNFTCIQCTRRLSRLAQSSKTPRNPVLQRVTPRVSHEYTSFLATYCLYSTASGRRVVRVAATPNTFAKVRFTRADVPPWKFWNAHARVPLVTDLSADECLQTARAYTDAALKNAPGWQERLITTTDRSPDSKGKGKTLSAYTLHCVSVMMAMKNSGKASHIATHILHTLIGLDYAPSILTLVRMALQRKVLDKPQFEPAVQAFERMLKRISDSNNPTGSGSNIDLAADACTLRALMYAAEDTHEGDNNALRWFRRAYEIGSAASEPGIRGSSSATNQPPPKNQQGGEVGPGEDSVEIEGANFDPHWQWKVGFALGVAAIRMKRGELEKAADMYAIASSELNNAKGYLGMANVLEKTGNTDTDKYVEAIEKAAVSGDQEAAQKMGMREWGRAAEEGLSKWEKRKRQVIAEEWMAIAGAAVPTPA